MNLSSLRKGFTLIELLIVVAIIAILAAIAVPNFLEAQTRAKVSRTLTDMRSMVVGLESYAVDYNKYPGTDLGPANVIYGPMRLTTPIAYITSLFQSPWKEEYGGTKIADELKSYLYVRAQQTGTPNQINGAPDVDPAGTGGFSQSYQNDRRAYVIQGGLVNPVELQKGAWLLKSVGPDNEDDISLRGTNARIYDPTNGTVSNGDIVIFSDREGSLK